MSEQRPNIVLIVSDDHGYGDFGRFGRAEQITTPNLDRLAAGAVSCTNAYVTAPICSPSRAGLISGSYQQRWGARWFGDSRFPDELPSLAEQFAALGYATGYLGKVHYGPEGPGDRACPSQHGFGESFYGLAGRQQGRLNYLRHSSAAVEEYGGEASWRMAVQPMYEGDEEVEFEGFLTEEIGRRGADFIDRHSRSQSAEEPFFLMVAFNAVHNFCFQLPDAELAAAGLPAYPDWNEAEEPYNDWYERAIWPHLPNGREYYLAQLKLMDAEIGRLLDSLDGNGITDDTIVVYMTDNGGSTCNFGDNAPLRGGKYTLWEGGVRTPFLVRWPGGGLRGGREVGELVSSIDLYPSLLAAAGASPDAWSHCDGLDQLALWRDDGRAATGHEALHWDTGFQWSVREGDWKLHTVDDAAAVHALRDHEHAPIEVGLRLHDLGADPGEETDLAEKHPEIVQRLTQRHLAWRAEVGISA